ncbi:imidazolonepropionase [Methylobrevis albus]|uniref:Imidazolonepropionase n=1 Tax=Methylobrevis albus TaxID=2793297 RepID=A0A931I1Z8_9HYPH|nr:imidazolonepropionase [Methylobrevis albus]MBH0237471.1 imidazolonepropionase [Methylobrevis albus]
MTAVRIFRNARIVTMAAGTDLEPVAGAVTVQGGRIAHVGAEADIPAEIRAGAEITDCGGRLMTPGLIDCHTHLVHGGDRAREFELRLDGASYEEIARAGGGIASTVRATRAASAADLTASGLARLDRLLAEGVTTAEVKSGYGLDAETELRLLAVARGLGRHRPVRIVTSYLGAHALPPEATNAADRAAYLDLVCDVLIPAIARDGLADAVDGFCEGIAFSPAEIDQVFGAATAHGLPVKLHADQLSNLGGAALAARHGALSADHLEYTDAAGAAAMAAAGTVAVLLPGAFYVLRETQLPPVALFRRHGVPMAVATDCNPGTAPLTSLLTAMNMAATLFRMTVAECLAGVTREAARALGLGDEIGTIAPGKAADLALWDAERPSELVYRIGFNPLAARIVGGAIDPATSPWSPSP